MAYLDKGKDIVIPKLHVLIGRNCFVELHRKQGHDICNGYESEDEDDDFMCSNNGNGYEDDDLVSSGSQGSSNECHDEDEKK